MLAATDSNPLDIILISSAAQADASTNSLIKTYPFPPPSEFARRDRSGIRGTLECILHRRKHYVPAIKKVSELIINHVKSTQPNRIWAILSTTASIDITYKIARSTNIPILVHVWDDPRHIMQQRKIDRFHTKQTWNRFTEILKRASRLGVICEQMGDAYRCYSTAESIVIRHGLKNHVDPSYPKQNSNEFRIALTGSMYCYSAWKALQSALDILQWRINGKQVVLHVAGCEIDFRAFRPAQCVFHGWRDQLDIENLLSDCDLLYLPHPFEDWQRHLAELSFPTKFSTYVATGKPILLHAPSYSSVAHFAREHHFEPYTAELNPNKLANFLTERFSTPNQLINYCDLSAKIGSSILGKQQFIEATQRFLRT
jgi:glycosyltransferase involved in cell wall biosynthesis